MITYYYIISVYVLDLIICIVRKKTYFSKDGVTGVDCPGADLCLVGTVKKKLKFQ